MLYGELANGTRPRGAPKLRYKDQLKRTLALTNIDPSSWEQTARDRATWRRAVHQGTTAFEKKEKKMKSSHLLLNNNNTPLMPQQQYDPTPTILLPIQQQQFNLYTKNTSTATTTIQPYTKNTSTDTTTIKPYTKNTSTVTTTTYYHHASSTLSTARTISIPPQTRERRF
ncbi:hypothetical protein Pcinc_000623 [Petrolisthes cinctipes]|uniref:Uncharacterized protein n=1 Tax=Petrolisthes cinctipes TaxID=88211 RepID=A0AAE1GPD8_PETCI|nr:hypothetical protein Pcinc_000623 [Petrolisthes cinctipes]